MVERNKNSHKRVAITGLGTVSPLGIGVNDTWESLLAGKSGVAPITRFDASKHKTQIAAEVKGFDPEQYMDKRQARRMDVFIQYALAAAKMAMEDSRLKVTEENAPDIGCVLGCGLGGLTTVEANHLVLLDRGPDRVSPFFVPMLIGNMAPGMISISHNLKGPNLSISTACAAGTHAIGLAYELIKKRNYTAMLTGGSESVITPLAISGFNALKALSTRNDDPKRASRPFDKNRDGFIVGEGSGVLLLEEWDHAVARGATIYAEIIGFGLSGDAFHMTAPPENGQGAVSSMQTALEDANILPTDVDYINAHGTSTELNDAIETKAIKTVFGEHAYKLKISSTKSMTGHLLGAAGGLEAIFCALALKNSIIPPTINLDEADENCDLDYTPNKAQKSNLSVVLSNSFGFGGTNGTLVFKVAK